MQQKSSFNKPKLPDQPGGNLNLFELKHPDFTHGAVFDTLTHIETFAVPVEIVRVSNRSLES